MNGPGARCLAADLVAFDQRHYVGGGITERCNERRATFFAKLGAYILRWQPETGIHQSNIAPRSAKSDLLCFQNMTVYPALGGVKGG